MMMTGEFMNNLFLKIIIALNGLFGLFPCALFIAQYKLNHELYFLLFAVFFALQIILSLTLFTFICDVEDHVNDKNVHVSNEPKDKNK